VLGLVHIRRPGGREFHIVEAVTVKLQVPKEVPTNGTESKLVFDHLRK